MAKKSGNSREPLVSGKRYDGKYVAFAPGQGKRVIAWGKDPADVAKRARSRGVSEPALAFIPPAGAVMIL